MQFCQRRFEVRLPTSAEIRLGRPRKAPTIENAKLFTVKSIHKTIVFSSHNALFKCEALRIAPQAHINVPYKVPYIYRY